MAEMYRCCVLESLMPRRAWPRARHHRASDQLWAGTIGINEAVGE